MKIVLYRHLPTSNMFSTVMARASTIHTGSLIIQFFVSVQTSRLNSCLANKLIYLSNDINVVD